MTTVRVVTAVQAAARDAAAIAGGIPALALLRAAGAGAAVVIRERFPERVSAPIAVFAGPGNNGGDAWVVAGALAAAGGRVRVWEAGAPRSEEARAVRTEALSHVSLGDQVGDERLVVDGLLGTGSRGAPTGALAEGVERIQRLRTAGARVVALDLPTGVDANGTISSPSVDADLTVTFGTIKRGHLVARGQCGAVVVVDIGLGPYADLEDDAPVLIDQAWVAAKLPPIEVGAHKGTRQRVAIVGGARGMAGAPVLATRGAERSGVGMVRLVVAESSLAAVQSAAVAATAITWPASDEVLRRSVVDYASAVLIGPGLGTSQESRTVLEQVLQLWTGPIVADADALNLFAGDIPAFAARLGGRAALITPHVAEMARLIGATPEQVERERFDIARDLARALHATVLLKGVPTVISSPDGNVLVSATGTPVLATAGSGDVLSGVAVTLLAQTGDPLVAGACAAWAHGRAGEIANAGRSWRGVTLDDVVRSAGFVWSNLRASEHPPVLTWLPSIGLSE